jgi:hypothetical protein
MFAPFTTAANLAHDIGALAIHAFPTILTSASSDTIALAVTRDEKNKGKWMTFMKTRYFRVLDISPGPHLTSYLRALPTVM